MIISPVLASSLSLSGSLTTDFKILLITFKAPHGLVSCRVAELLQSAASDLQAGAYKAWIKTEMTGLWQSGPLSSATLCLMT